MKKNLLTLSLFILVSFLPAQTLVKDITDSLLVSGFINQLTAFDEVTLFIANDVVHGSELWKTDGTTAGTVMVKDINPGTAYSLVPRPFISSNYTPMVRKGDYVYFIAAESTSGVELWRTNGTDTGTTLVVDVRPGAGQGITNSLELVLYNNSIFYFQGNNGTDGNELWRSDGTPAGTYMVKNINPTGNSDPEKLIVANGKLYFVADDGVNGRELWISDGTSAGTMLVKDINPGVNPSSPIELAEVNGKLLFMAATNTEGQELWATDGTTAGTQLLKDIRPGVIQSAFAATGIVFNNKLFFWANDSVHGAEPWLSDGTSAGTYLLKDINPAGNGNETYYNTYGILNGRLFFYASNNVTGAEVWSTDGTAQGTSLLRDINPSSSAGFPYALYSDGDFLYFTHNDGTHGNEPYRSDGTAGGTVMLNELCPGLCTSGAQHYLRNGDKIFFVGLSGSGEQMLYKIDVAPTGIGQPVQWLEGVKVYPNPTNGKVTIALNETYKTVNMQIADIAGRMVYAANLSDIQTAELSINQPAGLYFVSVTTDEGKAVFKVIKH